MRDGPSITARLCAASRGAHLRLDRPPWVLEDRLADILSGFSTEELLNGTAEQLDQFQSPSTRATMTARSRFVEDLVAEIAASGPIQYVILGAGLDSFAYRRPTPLTDVTVYEVDHPATQRWKQNCLRSAGYLVPTDIHFVEVDFETEQFDDKLRDAGLVADIPTVFSLLGVCQYLTRQAFEDTLHRILSVAQSRCSLAMNFIPPISTLPLESAKAIQGIAEKSAAKGEPFLSYYSPSQMAECLSVAGFETVTVSDPIALRARYFDQREDGLTVGNVLHMVSAERFAPA